MAQYGIPTWWFPKLGAPFLGVFILGIMVYWGLFWGPYFGKLLHEGVLPASLRRDDSLAKQSKNDPFYELGFLFVEESSWRSFKGSVQPKDPHLPTGGALVVALLLRNCW